MFDELLLTVLLTSIPLILAATGELVVERSGVLNLGVEGMMLMGAVAAFGAASLSGSPYVGIIGGGIAGMAVAAIFALFVLGLATNQVATGLALTIFGTGLSGLIGAPLVGQAIDGLPALNLPLLSALPVVGVFFKLDILAYGAIVIVGLTSAFLMHSRAGLILRSVGINHDSAHALGYNVLQVRFFAILFGGFMAGLGGAYLPLVLTPHWAEGMTAGRGWIALGASGVCILAAMACDHWGGVIWRGNHYAACRTGQRLGNSSTISVHVALSGNDYCVGIYCQSGPDCGGCTSPSGKKIFYDALTR